MSAFQPALERLPQALRPDVAGHWESFTEAAKDGNVNLALTPEILDQLAWVWAGSDFVARACCRDPALLNDLLESADLATAYGPDGYRRRIARYLESVENEEQLGIALRRFRRREMARIAWRDLARLAPLTEILEDLSALADAAVDAGLQWLHDALGQRFGKPRVPRGEAQRMVVLGMGKLGGRELNYSSDIDLIFAFPCNGETDGRRRIANEEFFRRLGQRLIKALDEPTAEGFVFRVDMRLRPFGDSGPLAMPFGAFEDYYQNHGREWERYAMIKARAIAGDRMAGEHLLDNLRPFVYRRYLDYGAIEEMRTMKAMIAKEVERKGLQRNVKLGPGGIREIEFIGQVFQLIYGGRYPGLRERGILRILDHLAETGRLPPAAVTGLKDAYDFLRRVENRLQEWADQQTHNLPVDDLPRLRLAFAMGFADWETFANELARHLERVSSQFDHVFVTPESESAQKTLDYAAVWTGAAGEEHALLYLEEQGFDDPARAWKSMRSLRGSFSFRSLSQRGRERMDQLMPLLLPVVANAQANPAETLERIIQLFEAIARRSVYLSLLIENPLALSQLVKLCSASPWIGKYLALYPLLLDDLLDTVALYHPLDRFRLAGALGQALEKVPADDTEQVMDALRHFKQTNVLRVAAADVSDVMPLMVVSDHLTWTAEALLGKVLELAWADLAPRYGQPHCRVDGQLREAGFAIVAYGKLGGIELNYGSDLDLVFLHDGRGESQHTLGGSREIDNATFFGRLVQRIVHFLTTRTAAGELYEVDMRLRPSGRSGLLVSSLDAFAEYQRNQAWTWEHQALVRTRVVAGSALLAEEFDRIRREILGRERDATALRQDVREMRGRMREELSAGEAGLFDLKQDPGGIADIEFMVQYMILAHARQHPALLTYSDNIRQLDGLEEIGILGAQDAGFLRNAYRELRRRIHHLTLQEAPGLISDQELRECREGVVGLWRRLMQE